jgi:hypothetical protein
MDTSWFDSNWALVVATVVLSAATVALVIITGYYARETRNLVRVPFRPSLRPSFGHKQAQNYDIILQLKITNIGVGIAIDIEVKYSIKVDSTTGNTQIETIEEPLYPYDKSDPNKRSELSLDIKGLEHITSITQKEYYSQHKIKLNLKLKYKDLLGIKQDFKRDLDVSAEARHVRFID